MSFRDNDMHILSVGFMHEANAVEIQFVLKNEQTDDAGMLRTIVVNVDSCPEEIEEIHDLLEELTDKVWENIKRS